jgi:HAD superfamily hydrolase (TIGR01509 family)
MVAPRFDAVIFDMDGVLIDSEPIYLRATNAVLAREGKYLSPEENSRYIGWRVTEFLDDIIARLELAHAPQHYLDASRDELIHIFANPMEPNPGARELLAAISSAGLPRAVGSSNSTRWVSMTLSSLGLDHHFEIVVGGDQVTHAKPAPDIFHRCCDLLAVDPRRCAVIEDSVHGVAAGIAAGLTVIGLRTTSTAHLDLQGCLAVVDSLHECAELIGLR